MSGGEVGRVGTAGGRVFPHLRWRREVGDPSPERNNFHVVSQRRASGVVAVASVIIACLERAAETSKRHRYLMARAKKQKAGRPSMETTGQHVVVIPEEGIEVDLKQPWLAAVLAWLIPGLGHLYQGRTSKGLLFMVCVLGTFLYGFYLGGYKVVYASPPGQQPYRWQYWCQLPAGVVTLPAAIQRRRMAQGKAPILGNLMAPPASNVGTTSKDYSGNTVVHPDELSKWQHDHPFLFDLGTVYTMIAGLLNVLVIYDAAAGPFVILPEPKGKRKSRESEPPGDRKSANGRGNAPETPAAPSEPQRG